MSASATTPPCSSWSTTQPVRDPRSALPEPERRVCATHGQCGFEPHLGHIPAAFTIALRSLRSSSARSIVGTAECSHPLHARIGLPSAAAVGRPRPGDSTTTTVLRGLPATGGDSVGLVRTALLLLAMGAMLVVARRRRGGVSG